MKKAEERVGLLKFLNCNQPPMQAFYIVTAAMGGEHSVGQMQSNKNTYNETYMVGKQ